MPFQLISPLFSHLPKSYRSAATYIQYIYYTGLLLLVLYWRFIWYRKAYQIEMEGSGGGGKTTKKQFIALIWLCWLSQLGCVSCVAYRHNVSFDFVILHLRPPSARSVCLHRFDILIWFRFLSSTPLNETKRKIKQWKKRKSFEIHIFSHSEHSIFNCSASKMVDWICWWCILFLPIIVCLFGWYTNSNFQWCSQVVWYGPFITRLTTINVRQ